MAILSSFIGSLGSGLFFAVAFLFVLTTVVFFHELGHFLVARWNGVKISTFSIGFGKELFGFNDKHGTRWRFALIPLGGYVKFIDDENAASMPKKDVSDIAPEDQDGTFKSKTLGQKSAVVAAGPIANFILSIVIFAFLFMLYGERLQRPVIANVIDGMPAQSAGFRSGDEIKSVNGAMIESIKALQATISMSAGQKLDIGVLRDGDVQSLIVTPVSKAVSDRFNGEHNVGLIGIDFNLITPIAKIAQGSAAQKAGLQKGDFITHLNGQHTRSYSSLVKFIQKSAGQSVPLTIQRQGRAMALSITPQAKTTTNAKGVKKVVGSMGVAFGNEGLPISVKHYNPVSATWKGVTETYSVLTRTVHFIGQIIVGEQSYKNLGGPGKIAYVSGKVAQDYGLRSLISLIAILSISIGFMNLLPIPVLDGGHLMYYAIEAVRGKPLSESSQEFGFKIGMSLMLTLMILVFWNDTNFLIGLFG